jgi:hypothetical protein
MFKPKINVGYLVSYDYDFIFNSIAEIYRYVDQIVLAIDKNYRTWTGNLFTIENEFFNRLKAIDSRNIIEFYFEEFYNQNLTPLECEFLERNLLLQRLNKGWKIQLDVDEYFYDFHHISESLKSNWIYTIFPSLFPISISINWITLFKKTQNGFVFIDNCENTPLITNTSKNSYARENSNALKIISNNYAVHQSWARNEKEILQKIKNWGHVTDFDTEEFFKFWKDIDDNNYLKVKDFHPLQPEVWSKLLYIESRDVAEFISVIKNSKIQVNNIITSKVLLKSFYFSTIKIKSRVVYMIKRIFNFFN